MNATAAAPESVREDPLDVLERIHADARLLQELAGPALVVTIAPADVAVKPPPVATSRNPRGVELENQVLDLLAEGPLRQADVADRLGVGRKTARAVLKRLAHAGRVVGAGEARPPGVEVGRPSPVYQLPPTDGGESRLPQAHETLTDPTGPQSPAAALPPRPRPGPEKTEAQKRTHATRTRRQRTESVEVISDALHDGPLSAGEVADRTPLTRSRVTAVINNARGAFRPCGFRDGKQLWERRPLPEEQDDVVCRNGGGVVSETQLVECLRNWGPLTMLGIAHDLGCKASDVSLAMCPLEDQGAVVRIGGGKYELREAKAA